MNVEQMYTGCLSQAAYYIESNGEAAVIDPLRDIKPYLDMAEKNGAKIKYVFETHFHADFVSGHLDLADATGAEIVFGPNAEPDYGIHLGTDGEEFTVGNVKIKLIHTPGHTMESSTYLLINEEGKEEAIFTGDTLFLGDVGRPDLAVKSDLSQDDLARHLYNSLYNKLMVLDDSITIYPGHGAGSACGKSMSMETIGNLGEEKKTNYALQNLTEEDFVKQVTTGLGTPPAYFPKNAILNKQGASSYVSVMNNNSNGLSYEEFARKVEEHNALIVDTRSVKIYYKEFIPGSISLSLNGQFALWTGTLLEDIEQPIVVIAEEGREEESLMRLARIGYDNVYGWLDGGFATWKKHGGAYDSFETISAEKFVKLNRDEHLNVLDVRRPSEYNVNRLDGDNIQNMPLGTIREEVENLDRNTTWYLHCATGYRSVVAASIMKNAGFDNIINIAGGMRDLKQTDVALKTSSCQLTGA